MLERQSRADLLAEALLEKPIPSPTPGRAVNEGHDKSGQRELLWLEEQDIRVHGRRGYRNVLTIW